ncbi:MAG: DUF4163 domain-containing protein, partial [Candidatus Gracilibacteria bacterium]|nr:DUF4163 domain-containing protein [Candidatus Gracilibacteria bacterium]
MKKIFLSIVFFMLSFQAFADISTTEITISSSNSLSGEINLSNKADNYNLDIKIPLTDNQFLNKAVSNYVNNYISDFKARTNNFEKLSNNWKYELNISGEKNIVGTITTYKLTIYEFTGGAHGLTIIKTFNFSKDGKKITLKDKELLSKISIFSINYYKDLLKNGKIDT